MADRLTRRTVLGASIAGALAPSGVAAAQRLGERAGTRKGTADKLVWTLVAPPGADRRTFQEFVVRELAKTTGDRLPGTNSALVTLQGFEAVSTASVGAVSGGERPVDAVLEITSDQPYAPLKEVNAHLAANCGHAQGWRVHPTTIYDTSVALPRGGVSEKPHLLVFVERLDGTTPEHFDYNWYLHAGHLDGKETENPASRAERIKKERARPGLRYVQNRVVEPITPTAWRVNGYTALLMPEVFRANTLGGAAPPRWTPDYGEKYFEEWPPRLVHGFQHRVL